MEALTNLLAGIGETLFVVFSFIMDTVSNTVYILRLLWYFVGNIPRYFSWLPSEFVTIIVFIFSIAVIYKIMGREG